MLYFSSLSAPELLALGIVTGTGTELVGQHRNKVEAVLGLAKIKLLRNMAHCYQPYRNFAFNGALPLAVGRQQAGRELGVIQRSQRRIKQASRPNFSNPAMHSRKLALGFLAMLTTAVGVVSIGGLVSSKTTSLAVLSSNQLQERILSSSAPANRIDFLAKMDSSQRREVASQIHYVSQIISESNSKVQNLDAMATTIVRQSRLANVDPLFVTAVIKAESTFKNHATSIRGAQGLMQIMPDTGHYIAKKVGGGRASLRDPEENIRLGIAYLKYLENYFGKDRKKILIAYNWGPANLMDALKNGRPALTSSAQYAQKILNDQRRWQGDFQTRIAQYRYMNLDKLIG